MEPITYTGPGRQIVRRRADVLDDDDWADVAVSIPADSTTWPTWGVHPMRSGAIGALKQLKLDVVFLTAADVEIGGVTFDFYTFDVITRQELGMRKPTARPFVRKTGAGTGFVCEESIIVDVNGTEAMGICITNITDGSGLATNYMIVAKECDYR